MMTQNTSDIVHHKRLTLALIIMKEIGKPDVTGVLMAGGGDGGGGHVYTELGAPR